MKRLCTLLILCGLVLTACGSPANDTTVTTQSDETTVADTTAELTGRDAVKCSLPEDVRFDGKTVNILVRDDPQYLIDVFSEQTGDVVNDAVFARNLAVSERLGIKLEHTAMEDKGGAEISKRLKESVLAGDEPYQLAFGGQYYSTSSALEGIYYDLLDMKYIDPTAPYYSQGFVEAATIHNKLYYDNRRRVNRSDCALICYFL